jgi:acetyl esterase
LTNIATARHPLGIRLMARLRKEPDWLAMSPAALDAFRVSENRKRSSALARIVTGFPDRRADIAWRDLALPGRRLRVRVHRPTSARRELPLVLHVHGGGFVGTATQSDWVNSHLAARLPAVVVSVEHRLIAADTPLSTAVDDGWDALRQVTGNAAAWGVDPGRAAVFGESAGATIAALAAIRAREASLPLRAQVLVNPCTDLTSTAFDYPSMREHATSPTLTATQMELFRDLAVPDSRDARDVSPLYAEDLSGLPPALVIVPTLDPVADQGRAYATRLRAAGTAADLTEHPGAPHAFLSMPGIVRQARAARKEIADFLGERLAH